MALPAMDVPGHFRDRPGRHGKRRISRLGAPMGKAQRAKGRRGQTAAAEVLRGRDWKVADLSGGTAVEDFIAVDPDARIWSVEVKNTVSITTAHREQAMRQAKERRMPWLLMSKISGTSSWLVQRQGERPVVWHGGEE